MIEIYALKPIDEPCQACGKNDGTVAERIEDHTSFGEGRLVYGVLCDACDENFLEACSANDSEDVEFRDWSLIDLPHTCDNGCGDCKACDTEWREDENQGRKDDHTALLEADADFWYPEWRSAPTEAELAEEKRRHDAETE